MTAAPFRDAASLSEAERDKIAAGQRAQEKIAAKVRRAFENGERHGQEATAGMAQQAIQAVRAEHEQELTRRDQREARHVKHASSAAFWRGGLIGGLLAAIATAVGLHLYTDAALQSGFTAASDATARGVAVGALQRRAEGNEAGR